jgi:hypothetical protein
VLRFLLHRGAHTWEVDSCAFFLAEKLLKPGGWMLFDDLTWTAASSPEATKHWPEGKEPTELMRTAQVSRIFELCVTQHPGFDSFTITDDWGWARKKAGVEQNPSASVTRLFTHHNGSAARLRRLGRRLLGKMK